MAKYKKLNKSGVIKQAILAAANTGRKDLLHLIEPYIGGEDEKLDKYAKWAAAQLRSCAYSYTKTQHNRVPYFALRKTLTGGQAMNLPAKPKTRDEESQTSQGRPQRKHTMTPYILVLAVTATTLCTVITVFAIMSIQAVVFSTIDSAKFSHERSSNVQTIQLSFEKILRHNDNLFVHIEDLGQINNIEHEIKISMSSILESIDTYYIFAIAVPERESIQALSGFLDDYFAITVLLIEHAKNGNLLEMESLLFDISLLSNDINAELQEISDIEYAKLCITLEYAERQGHTILLFMIVIFSVALNIIIIVSICIIYMIKKKLSSP